MNDMGQLREADMTSGPGTRSRAGQRAAGVVTCLIDPDDSSVSIHARNRMSAGFRGVFRYVAGTLTLDHEQPERTAFAVYATASSLDTGSEERDARHVRSRIPRRRAAPARVVLVLLGRGPGCGSVPPRRKPVAQGNHAAARCRRGAPRGRPWITGSGARDGTRTLRTEAIGVEPTAERGCRGGRMVRGR